MNKGVLILGCTLKKKCFLFGDRDKNTESLLNGERDLGFIPRIRIVNEGSKQRNAIVRFII